MRGTGMSMGSGFMVLFSSARDRYNVSLTAYTHRRYVRKEIFQRDVASRRARVRHESRNGMGNARLEDPGKGERGKRATAHTFLPNVHGN